MTTKSKFGLAMLAVLAVSGGSMALADKQTAPSNTAVLKETNLLVLNSEVNGESVGNVISKAKQLDADLTKKNSKEPLYLYLKTPGGSIQAGLELIEALRGLGRPVNTITAFAASMGFQIAQNLDQRLILDKGVLMSHHAYGSFEGAFGGTSPSQVDQRKHLWDQVVTELDQKTVDRTNGKQTLASYQKLYDKEVWMTGHESVAGGFADAITKVRCDSSISGVDTKHASFMGMDIAYDIDKCPINSSPQNVRLNAAGATKEYSDAVKSQFLSTYQSQFSTSVAHPYFW